MPIRIAATTRKDSLLNILDDPVRSLVLEHLFVASGFEPDAFSDSPCFPLSRELQALSLTCKAFRQEIRARQLKSLTLDAGNFISLAQESISAKEREHIRRVSHVYPSFGMFTQGKAAWQLLDSLPNLEYLRLLHLDDTVWEISPYLPNLLRMQIKSHFHLKQFKHWNLNASFPSLTSLRLPFSSCAAQNEALAGVSESLLAPEAITCGILQHVEIDFGSSVQHFAAVAQHSHDQGNTAERRREYPPKPDFALYRWIEYFSSNILGRTVPAQTDIKQRLLLGAGLQTVTLNIDYITLFRKFGVLRFLTEWTQEHVRDARHICINIHLKTSPVAYVTSFCSFGQNPYSSGPDWFSSTLPSDAELTECGETLARHFFGLSQVHIDVLHKPTLPGGKVCSLMSWTITTDRDRHDKIHANVKLHRSNSTYTAFLNVFDAAWKLYKRSCPHALVEHDI